MRELVWTVDSPFEPGWYWWAKYNVKGRRMTKQIVKIVRYQGELKVIGWGPPGKLGGAWAGPIMEPTELGL